MAVKFLTDRELLVYLYGVLKGLDSNPNSDAIIDKDIFSAIESHLGAPTLDQETKQALRIKFPELDFDPAGAAQIVAQQLLNGSAKSSSKPRSKSR